ncbi:MAG: aspartate ammonia-lyase [Candidatus Thorarchaeota archaeon]|nr:MAG: aspartate ammonia-lyase [Candidatus Thorarchaeota archaeon]
MSGERIEYREESDLLGTKRIPRTAYWGVQTLRAHENFAVSLVPLSNYALLISAMAMVKKACTLANMKLGDLKKEYGGAIVQACDEVIAGKFRDEFIVDMLQGGAGTSTNMNVNEVIASRANEILGNSRNSLAPVSANDHVNMSQSTNDVYPTAIKIAAIFNMRDLVGSLGNLAMALDDKAEEYKGLLKLGRTEMQDAVPITLGQEFSAWSSCIKRDILRIGLAIGVLDTHNIGATAIGTGLNADPEYIRLSEQYLREVTGQTGLKTAENLIDETQNADEFVHASGLLRVLATNLCKICGDLLLLSSGPIGGFHEITLPAMQPGSSIMPGKINPVIVEMMMQCAFQVLGHDATISHAAESGMLELNAYGPLLAYNLFQALKLLRNAIPIFTEKCVKGIKANKSGLDIVYDSVGLVTALVPIIGYSASSRIAKKALETSRSVRDLVLEEGLMTAEELDEALSPERMTRPGIAGHRHSDRIKARKAGAEPDGWQG